MSGRVSILSTSVSSSDEDDFKRTADSPEFHTTRWRSSSAENETKEKADRRSSLPNRRRARERLSPQGRVNDPRFRFAPLDEFELLKRPPNKLNLSDDIILEEEDYIRQEADSPASSKISLPFDLSESFENRNRLGPLGESIEELDSEDTAIGISIRRDSLISKL